jgi:hypothetical protein
MTPLNKEDFTEEQWAEIEASIDRERTKASKTARTNALKEAQSDIDDRIQAAIELERAKLEADEQGKLEIERKAIEKAQAELASERKTLKATKKLVSAGFGDEEVEALMPMFVAVDDNVLDSAVDNFIKVSEARVKHQVDTVKETLLDNATPPASPNNAPTDLTAEAEKLAATAGDLNSQAQAAELLLQGALT